MNDPKCIAAAPPPAYNDERFQIIHNRTRELKGLLHDLNDMVYKKFDELLGSNPAQPTGADVAPADSWAARVINEQDIAMSVARDTLERLSMV